MDVPLRFAEAHLDRGQGKTVTDKISNTIELNEHEGARLSGIHAITQPTRRSTTPGGTPGGDCDTFPGNGPWPCQTTHNAHERYCAKRGQQLRLHTLASSHPPSWPLDARGWG
jgi:hypothetical protein